MKEDFKKLVSYYKPYKAIFFTDLLLAALASAIVLSIPLIGRFIIEKVIYLDKPSALNTVAWLGAFMALLIVLYFLCHFFITYFGHIIGVKMEGDMREEIFSHYQKLSLSFFDNQKIGQLMSRVTVDLHNISEILHHGPEDLIISILKIIGAFVILSSINVPLAILTICIIPIAVVYCVLFFPKINKAFRHNHQKLAEINAQLEDSLSGMKIVKSFTNETLEKEKFTTANNNFFLSRKKTLLYVSLYFGGAFSIIVITSPIIFIFGSLFIINNSLSLGDLLIFLSYMGILIDPIFVLTHFIEQLEDCLSGYQRFLEIIRIKPLITEKPGAVALNTVRGDISFKDVSFYYTKGKNVLSHINMDIKSGEYVALVGVSGAGKTTLCNLIPRFYDVKDGRIEIDGNDIRNLTIKSLRQSIGMVQQDLYLFSGTVKDNIHYGKLGATDKEIIEAAKKANAHEFIMNFSKGYDTPIGQRGVKLSGGQKQRLSIARMFLKNPQILILDEATSALDNESEQYVQKSLEALSKNRTTIVIAHRLSTIRHAQRIIVLSPDGVCEEGTHVELLNKNGIYAKLYHMQFDNACIV